MVFCVSQYFLVVFKCTNTWSWRVNCILFRRCRMRWLNQILISMNRIELFTKNSRWYLWCYWSNSRLLFLDWFTAWRLVALINVSWSTTSRAIIQARENVITPESSVGTFCCSSCGTGCWATWTDYTMSCTIRSCSTSDENEIWWLDSETLSHPTDNHLRCSFSSAILIFSSQALCRSCHSLRLKFLPSGQFAVQADMIRLSSPRAEFIIN